VVKYLFWIPQKEGIKFWKEFEVFIFIRSMSLVQNISKSTSHVKKHHLAGNVSKYWEHINSLCHPVARAEKGKCVMLTDMIRELDIILCSSRNIALDQLDYRKMFACWMSKNLTVTSFFCVSHSCTCHIMPLKECSFRGDETRFNYATH
jgi:hypothetical protein